MSKSNRELITEENLWEWFESAMRDNAISEAFKTINYAKYLGYEELAEQMQASV